MAGDNSSNTIKEFLSVPDYYAGKSIFITGGTGFLGTVLIEKLLYSCPKLKQIYVLLRTKKGVPPQERVKILLDSPVFDRLKSEKPENLKKIIPISGELTEPNLGIALEELQMLKDKVSIVFHLAATLKFNEPLSVAMKTNVKGTEEVMNLSRSMKRIEVFVYMSTIFSNTNNKRFIIEEKLYECPKSIEEVYRIIEEYNESEIPIEELLEGRPNSYTYTKCIAEQMIAEKRKELPTVIIRPSIVISAMNEPIKGWTANWMGPTPFFYALGKGWFRTVYGDDNYTLEVIPVDYVVNLTIISAASHRRSKDLEIYHSCTSSLKPVTIGDACAYYLKESKINRAHILPYPGIRFTKSTWFLKIIAFFLQIIPAYIADLCLFISGRPIRFIKMQQKISLRTSALKYFSSLPWHMRASRGQTLFRSLDNKDKQLFPCDPEDINWEEYFATYYHGISKFLLKKI